MKNRWIVGLVTAIALLLGACAPPGGAQETDAADQAAESASPTAEADATESAEASEDEDEDGGEGDDSGADDYDY